MRTLQSLYCGLALSLAWAAAAQAQTAEPGTEPASVTKKDAVSTTATKGKPGDESAGELEEIVVTGTLIRGASAVGAPVIELDRKDIEATGAKTSADLFATLPQMQSFNSLPTGTPDQSEPIPRTNLRGFALSGSQATLVLLNGHRMVGAGVLQTSPDPSSIPIAAIERVEVLADGASAIYGADAVAGVVNIILRKDYDGAETHLDYGVADSYSQYSASQLLGTQWDTGSIMVVVE
jgi:iron complex outermembrane receptor protein